MQDLDDQTIQYQLMSTCCNGKCGYVMSTLGMILRVWQWVCHTATVESTHTLCPPSHVPCQFLPKTSKVKGRWDDEESVLMTQKELQLQVSRCSNINQQLVLQMSGKTLNAIKNQRQSNKYKDLYCWWTQEIVCLHQRCHQYQLILHTLHFDVEVISPSTS